MKAAPSLRRWLLFLAITWFAYNSPLPFFIIFSIAQDISQGFDARISILSHLRGEWGNFFGLSQFIPSVSELRHSKLWWLAVALCLYALVANVGALYLWLRRQSLMSAWILAMAACFAGPYSEEMLWRSPLWTLGVCACSLAFLLLFLANRLRKKKFPGVRLPQLSEWKMPGLVPPLSRFAPFRMLKAAWQKDRGKAPAASARPNWPVFLLISWLIYNTGALCGTLAAFYPAEDAKLATDVFVYCLLLGGMDIDDTLTFFGAILVYPMGGESPLAHAPLWLYLIAIDGGALYLWLRRQSLMRAWVLAMAGCFAGPLTLALFQEPGIWLYGFAGACLFYCFLCASDIFLKKYIFAAGGGKIFAE